MSKEEKFNEHNVSYILKPPLQDAALCKSELQKMHNKWLFVDENLT